MPHNLSALDNTPRSPLRILIADDNPEVCNVLSAILEDAGHAAVAVCNGRQVLAEIVKQAFDVLILNLMMPERDRIETMIDLRRLGFDCNALKILAMSGRGEFLETVIALGADAFLEKPFGNHELLAVVNRLITPES